ncbi:MAG: DUF5652 family protein [Bacteroidetes bacterium]|nr:DUF5652 family protein [Bacteroidota bacterium]
MWKPLIDFSTQFTMDNPFFTVTICLLIIWELIWKGLALWRAAKNHHKTWFVCILIFNTAGILPIIYLSLNKMRKG